MKKRLLLTLAIIPLLAACGGSGEKEPSLGTEVSKEEFIAAAESLPSSFPYNTATINLKYEHEEDKFDGVEIYYYIGGEWKAAEEYEVNGEIALMQTVDRSVATIDYYSENAKFYINPFSIFVDEPNNYFKLVCDEYGNPLYVKNDSEVLKMTATLTYSTTNLQ